MSERNEQGGLQDLLLKVRAELNHLYTEPLTAQDAGLFCREHALHLHGLATALGHSSEICTGCFGLRVPGQFTNAMTNSDAEHAWCRIDRVAPVDVSLTLKGWPLRRADVRLIYGTSRELLNGFELKYLVGCPSQELEGLLGESRTDLLVYSEHRVLRRSASELHADPFSFLRAPPRGAPSMLDLLGHDIFFAITLHCLKLGRGQVKPLATYRDQWSALRAIAGWYPRARQEMELEWAGSGSKG